MPYYSPVNAAFFNPNLKYHGYFTVFCTDGKISNIKELKNLGNTNFILPSGELSKECLEAFRNNNLKILVGAYWQFFEGKSASGAGYSHMGSGVNSLRPVESYEFQWSYLKNILKGYEDI